MLMFGKFHDKGMIMDKTEIMWAIVTIVAFAFIGVLLAYRG